jgi:hypothetical protein
MLIEERVYLGTDNLIGLALRSNAQDITHNAANRDDTVIDVHSHPTITRCVIVVSPIVGDPTDSQAIIDSTAHVSWFDFSDPEILKIKLGAATIKPGRHVAKINIYEAANPLGVQWAEIMLVVK